MNIARGGGSLVSRSAPSSFGFSVAVTARPKNAALTGQSRSLGIAADAPTAARPCTPIRMMPRSALLDDGVDDALGDVDHCLADP